MADCNSTLTLTGDTIASIRDALQIGLASYGEIKRDRRVIHPTGAADTVSRFAAALRALG